MKTIGDFHEIMNKFMDVADFLGDNNEIEKKQIVCDMIKNLYEEHLELAIHLKENDPYLVSLNHIKNWLSKQTHV